MSDVGVPGYEALGLDINKVKGDSKETKEGIVGEQLPELELSMDDTELLELTKKWEKAWEPYSTKLKARQKTTEEYWLGKTKFPFGSLTSGSDDKPFPDNILFESLETFLPIATSENPEPLVEADNTPEGNALAYRVMKMLAFLASKLALKLTIKQVLRFWSLYFLGVGKVGWNIRDKEITFKAIRPQAIKIDPNATIINGEYQGEWIGEIRKDTAETLIAQFPKKKEFISELVKGNLGTELNYTEWWTDEALFWTLKGQVLDKMKNPHWNYASQSSVTDEMGNVSEQEVPGRNHFLHSKKPYVFLSIFNLGVAPFDETNLMHQNLKNQDLVSKRLSQIDINADNTNGGAVVSGTAFTKEQAASVGDARRRGDTIWVPNGDINAAYRMDVGPSLPAFVYQSLQDYRQELRGNFGVQGSSPSGTKTERTVRGKQIQKQHDLDRIGGGVTVYVEQFASQVLNWFVQMMYVYYDEPHATTVLGKERAREYITLKSSDFIASLVVSIKDGSLLPKDPVSRREEALELWTAGALDPIALFEALDFPNPRESAKNMLIWNMVKAGSLPPQVLFPDFPQAPPPAPMLGAPPGGVPQPQ